MSKVRKSPHSPRLSAHAVVPSFVWHTSAFMRSLQLVIYRIRNFFVSPQVTSRLGGRARFMSTRSRFLTKSRIRPSFFVHDGNLYRGFTMSKRLLIIFCALFA